MRWVLEKHLQPVLQPRWRERWQVKRARRNGVASKNASSKTENLRNLFVDVSVIARHDAGTGIQRVVRHVALELLQNPPAGWRVMPVGATRKRPYHPIHWPDHQQTTEYALPAKAGDVFLGLDYALDTVCLHERQLETLREQGVTLWFVIYDLLPWQHPNWFAAKMVVRYRKWLSALARRANGFLSISPTTETTLRDVLTVHYQLTNDYHTCIMPMGWDFTPPNVQQLGCTEADDVLHQLGGRPTALIVGTLEPRKGHADVLAAFEALWQAGNTFNLLIAGKPGWKTEQFQTALRHHPHYQRHLFWLDDVSDILLACLYAACTGVIAASYAEGFGLPLLEALGQGKSVLARDIPVFHTLQLEGLSYFPQHADTSTLAQHIQHWLQSAHPPVTLPQLPTWSGTTKVIVDAIQTLPLK